LNRYSLSKSGLTSLIPEEIVEAESKVVWKTITRYLRFGIENEERGGGGRLSLLVLVRCSSNLRG